MLKSISGVIKKVFLITDMLAGVCMFSVMALVLANIIMRNVFKQPITGTVEIVGLLVATGLGLAMANCEMLDGHIGMDIDLPFSPKIGKFIEILKYLISLGFWGLVAWRIFIFASTSYVNGRVTATASIPVYPFIFILGVSMFCLCVALMYKLVCAVKKPAAEFGKSAKKGEEENK
ncbi:MAG: TRAP transporter small permease [Oscillospiraceae bacterium]|nr:TRAP transporter small permease [Oscillospiraceae bacterium]